MRLAIVTHNVIFGDGQSRVSYEIARHAVQQGIDVTVFADQVDPSLLEMGVQWVRVQPQGKFGHLWKVRQFARMADRALEKMQERIDVIQAFGYVLSVPHHANNSQFVHHAWGQSPVHTSRLRRDLYGVYQRAYTLCNTRWERQAYSQAQVVVPSSRLIEQQLQQLPLGGKPMQVILNGVDLQEFFPGAEERTALGLPAQTPLAAFVGDIRTPRKNLDTALKALVQVPALHLAVVGAVARSPYPKLAATLGIANRVHFLDFRRDIPQILRAADLFVFPSRYEACSLVILEALASGLPVITARTAGGAEIVTPESGIVLSDPNDAAALANALKQLTGNPERLKHMGHAARAVAERHSWASMVNQYLELYRTLSSQDTSSGSTSFFERSLVARN